MCLHTYTLRYTSKCMHMYTPITIQTCSYNAQGGVQGPGIGYGQRKCSQIEKNGRCLRSPRPLTTQVELRPTTSSS